MNCFVLYSVYTIMFVKSVSNSRGHYLLTQSLVKGCPIFSNSNDFVNSLLFCLEFSSLTCYLYRSFTDMIPPFAYSNLNHDLCLSVTVWNNESPVAKRDVRLLNKWHLSLFCFLLLSYYFWHHYQLAVF